ATGEGGAGSRFAKAVATWTAGPGCHSPPEAAGPRPSQPRSAGGRRPAPARLPEAIGRSRSRSDRYNADPPVGVGELRAVAERLLETGARVLDQGREWLHAATRRQAEEE